MALTVTVPRLEGDPLRLTPEGRAAIARDFPLTGGAGGPVPPAYAGTGHDHSWNAPVYNRESHHISRIAGGIMSALYAGEDYTLAFFGDSKTERDGAAAGEGYLYAPCMQFARAIGGVEGFAPAQDTGNIFDDRWTTTAGFDGPTGARMGIVGTGTVTFTFEAGHTATGGTFWIHSDTAQTIQVNGQAVDLPATASATDYTPVTVTGTGTHEIVTTGDVLILGISPTYGGPRLKIARAARAGSAAVSWTHGPTRILDHVMGPVDPDAVVLQVGTNSAETSETPIANAFAALDALGVATLIATPGGLTRSAAYDAVWAALWDAADAHDFPLLDLESVLGEGPVAQNLGLMFDQVHENRRGGAFQAAALRELLA